MIIDVCGRQTSSKSIEAHIIHTTPPARRLRTSEADDCLRQSIILNLLEGIGVTGRLPGLDQTKRMRLQTYELLEGEDPL